MSKLMPKETMINYPHKRSAALGGTEKTTYHIDMYCLFHHIRPASHLARRVNQRLSNRNQHFRSAADNHGWLQADISVMIFVLQDRCDASEAICSPIRCRPPFYAIPPEEKQQHNALFVSVSTAIRLQDSLA